MKEEVRILPIGGQSELGENMVVIKINHHMFIVDAGYRIPESDKLGIDIIIPDFTYLIDHQDEIEAIIITHGHNDSMAAIPYLLREINAPIYTSRLTAAIIDELINHYNRKSNQQIKPDIHIIHRKSTIEIAGIQVRFFPLTHSIPGTIGVAFNTPYGYIVHLGEFMIDYGAPSYFKTDIQSMMEIGSQNTLALLCESSYAKRTGYTAPYHKVYDTIKPVFEDSEGRIIIATYAQNIFRIKEIVDLARMHNRKVVIYGKNKYDNLNVLVRYMETNETKPVIDLEGVLVDNSAIKTMHDDLVVLLTGDPTHLYRDINEVIQGEDELLTVQEGDTFVLACEKVPGTEKLYSSVVDELYKTDAKIIRFKESDGLSMHASTEDLKVALQIFHPKYYIPIRGEYQHFIACREIAEEMGMDGDNVIIMDNGEEYLFENGVVSPNKNIYHIGDVMIDGIGIGDVGDKVIDDRIQLSNDGVVVIGLTVNHNREIVTFTDVQTRGFVYLKDSEYIVREISKISEDTIRENEKNYAVNLNDIRMMIKDRVNRYIYQTTGKKPVILPVIIEIQ